MPVHKRLALGASALLASVSLALGFAASTQAEAAPRPQVWNADGALSGQGPAGSVVFGDSIVMVEQVRSPAAQQVPATAVSRPAARPGGRTSCAQRPARRPVPRNRARHHVAKRHHHTGRQYLARRHHHTARHHVAVHHHLIQSRAHRV